MLALAIALICVVITLVIVALNERSTQSNADIMTAQNQQLQDELQCLRPPALAFDRQIAELQIAIARGLAAVADGDTAALQTLGPELREESSQVETALQNKEESLTTCTAPERP